MHYRWSAALKGSSQPPLYWVLILREWCAYTSRMACQASHGFHSSLPLHYGLWCRRTHASLLPPKEQPKEKETCFSALSTPLHSFPLPLYPFLAFLSGEVAFNLPDTFRSWCYKEKDFLLPSLSSLQLIQLATARQWQQRSRDALSCTNAQLERFNLNYLVRMR